MKLNKARLIENAKAVLEKNIRENNQKVLELRDKAEGDVARALVSQQTLVEGLRQIASDVELETEEGRVYTEDELVSILAERPRLMRRYKSEEAYAFLTGDVDQELPPYATVIAQMKILIPLLETIEDETVSSYALEKVYKGYIPMVAPTE